MNSEQLRHLLEKVKSGDIGVGEALDQLRFMPYEDIGFAKLDHHRSLRRGFAEVILCKGKTADQVAGIVKRMAASEGTTLATKASPEIFDAVRQVAPGARYHQSAGLIVIGDAPPVAAGGYILVVTAGTGDIPVAEEAAVTAETMGSPVERAYDVGVAGLHRLLDCKDKLLAANVIVAVAGMEGALASVVSGMVDTPVIAVPTSVGYGASFQGLAALLGMLNSCSPGVSVVNIDNGFGAGYLASLINRRTGVKR
ncbi:MAG TPA: nickel pincer cofactor biosynthesis protein LarB [Dehalococcoidia bacterium]|nr:nickel pincer cofactor biosynthesis protein LarB [Dehalococcoidia bacterium]